MKNKEILIEIIEKLYEYENNLTENDNIDFTGFLNFLNRQYEIKQIGIRDIQGEKEKWLTEESNKDNTDISILVSLMYKYAKGYIKKALKNSHIKTADEFSILITLLTYDSLTKTELINKVLMEKTSGIEIINRLINLKFIEQFEDLKNKRNVRIKVTEVGKYEIIKTLPLMKKVSIIVAGNLSESEKNVMIYLLKKLDKFHNDIFTDKKSYGLDDIINTSQIEI